MRLLIPVIAKESPNIGDIPNAKQGKKKTEQKEGAWFDALPPEMQKQYVEEHPGSKYAKEYQKRHEGKEYEGQKLETEEEEAEEPQAEPEQPKEKKSKKGKTKKKIKKLQKQLKELQKSVKDSGFDGKVLDEEEEGETPTGKPEQEGKPNPKPKKHNPNVSKLPKSSQEFIDSSETESGSKQRKSIGSSVVKASKHIASSALKETKGLKDAVVSAASVLEGQGSRSDLKSIAKVGFMLLASSALASTLAVSGPAAVLTFMAIKHIGVPAMGNMVKAAFNRGPSTSKVKYEYSEAYKKSGAKGISPYGYWKDRDTWFSETKEEWEAAYDEREDEAGSFASVVASVLAVNSGYTISAAHNPEEAVEAVVQQLGMFAAEGQIEDNQWDDAVNTQAKATEDEEFNNPVARLAASLTESFVALHPNDSPGPDGTPIFGEEWEQEVSDILAKELQSDLTEGDLDSEVDDFMDQQWFGRTDVDRGNYPVTNTQLTGDRRKKRHEADSADQGLYNLDRDGVIDQRYGEGTSVDPQKPQRSMPIRGPKPAPKYPDGKPIEMGDGVDDESIGDVGRLRGSDGEEEIDADADPKLFRLNNMQPLGPMA